MTGQKRDQTIRKSCAAGGEQRKNSGKWKMRITWLCIFLLAFLLLSNMEYVGIWMTQGLKIAAFKVLPSVFPYLVLTGLICRSGLAKRLGWFLGRPFGKLFRLSSPCFTAVLLGLVSGFPLGAKCAVELYDQNLCTKEEAERLTAFCNFCGPPFILGAVGQGIFGSVKIGWMIYFIQAAVSLVFGFFYMRPKKSGKTGTFSPDNTLEKEFSPSAFTDILSDSCRQMLSIVGFVLFFALLVGGLGRMFHGVFERFPLLSPLFAGFFEMSSGIAAVFKGGASGLVISALVVGFSGMSVFMQVWGFARERQLSMKGYLAAHLLCPPLVAVLSLGAAQIFGIF